MNKLVNRKAGINIMWVSNISILIQLLCSICYWLGKILSDMHEFNQRTHYNFGRLLNIEESAPMVYSSIMIIIGIMFVIIASLMIVSVPIIINMYNKNKVKQAMILTVVLWIITSCWIVIQLGLMILAQKEIAEIFSRTAIPTIFTVTSIIITLLSV